MTNLGLLQNSQSFAHNADPSIASTSADVMGHVNEQQRQKNEHYGFNGMYADEQKAISKIIKKLCD